MSIITDGEKIIIDGEDAKEFLALKLYRDKFVALLQAGVFELKNGKAEVNCANGQIQIINIHTRTYKRAVDNGTIPI